VNPRLSEAEAELKQKAQGVCAEAVRPEAASVDAELAFPAASLEAMADAGLLGVCLPEQYGGAGGGPMELALVLEEVGRVSASLGAVLVHHIGIVGRTLAAHGTEAQKEQILPDVITGKRVAVLASVPSGATGTMLEAGVAISGIEGEEELSGTVPAVTGATVAGLFLVPGVSYEPQPEGVSGGALFVLDRGSDGLGVGDEEIKLGLNGSGIATMTLEGVRVGSDERLPADACGPGMLRQLTDAANLGYAAVAVGIAQAALDAALGFLAGSDDDLKRSQSIQWMLADSATETDAARLMTWYAATREGTSERTESAAMARLLACNSAVSSSRSAVQILGQGGGLRASGVERLYRDAKMIEIHDGSIEMQRRATARKLLPDVFSAKKKH
jgi:alkylation response protein AidB-like acyl-CoA dehydrogenase